jgi:hypothetical protein
LEMHSHKKWKADSQRFVMPLAMMVMMMMMK